MTPELKLFKRFMKESGYYSAFIRNCDYFNKAHNLGRPTNVFLRNHENNTGEIIMLAFTWSETPEGDIRRPDGCNLWSGLYNEFKMLLEKYYKNDGKDLWNY